MMSGTENVVINDSLVVWMFACVLGFGIALDVDP